MKSTQGADWSRGFAWTAAGAAILLALALRLFRLEDVTTSLDELGVIGYLGTPRLSEFLTFIRYPNPETLPVYPVLAHVLKHAANLSLYQMRVGSILISLLAFPALYALTARVFSRRAAVMALLLYAVSAPQIWHAHTIRFYILFPILAVISIYLLLRAIESGAALVWLAYFVSLALMMWTHAFLVFLIAAHGIYLLLFTRLRWRHCIAWGLASAVIVVSPLVWLRESWHRIPTAEANDEHRLPTLNEALFDLFADDAVVPHKDFEMDFSLPHFEALLDAHPGEYPWLELQRTLRTGHWLADYALMGFYLVCIGWCIARNAPRAWQLWRGRAAGADIPALRGEALLLTCGLLPLLFMLAMSFLWRPIVEPRFTIYSPVLLYALAGGMLALLRGRGARALLVSALALVYGYQLLMFYPYSQTTSDWAGANRHVLAELQPDDLIVSRGMPIIKGTLDWRRFEMNRPELRQRTVYTLEAAADLAQCYLDANATRQARGVWAMFSRDALDLPYESSFEPALKARGLRFSTRDFPGQFPIRVYRIERDHTQTSLPDPPMVETEIDYARMKEWMGIAEPLAGFSEQETDRALRRYAVDTYTGPAILAQLAMDDGDNRFAQAITRIELAKYDPVGHTQAMETIASIRLGDAGAAAELDEVIKRLMSMGMLDEVRPLIPLIRLLYVDGDVERARAEALRIDPDRMFVNQYMREELGLEDPLNTAE
ncbi:MAG: hypothetical protein GC168_08630 [Candidatus Hydrogenedens sp.]|nr:hypothetical protein [Candidatus Hydrogenedens sp.]